VRSEDKGLRIGAKGLRSEGVEVSLAEELKD